MDRYPWADTSCSEREGTKPRRGKDTKLSGRTIRNQYALLCGFYERCKNRGLIARNPFKGADIELPHQRFREKRPTEILPFDKVHELVHAPGRKAKEDIRDSGILACLFGGGIRRGECIALTLDDVRVYTPKKGEIYDSGCPKKDSIIYLRLGMTKAGHPAEQALPDWAAQLLQRVVEVRISEGAGANAPLFTNYRKLERVATNEHMAETTFYRIFRQWCEACGLGPHFSPHSARATAISRLIAEGIDIRKVQDYARHASVTTTQDYDKRYFGVENSAALEVKYG